MNTNSKENQSQTMNSETEEKLEKKEASLSEITGEETMGELLDIYESSLKKFEEGQVVTGTVISIGRDTVLVDVGYKSEGQISIHEFIDEKGDVNVHVGDQVEVMIELWDEEEETVLLSHEKAKKVKVWDAIKDIYDADGTIKGVITSRVKGDRKSVV